MPGLFVPAGSITGQVLVWNNNQPQWGAENLVFDITSVADGNILAYNAAEAKWTNRATLPATAGVDSVTNSDGTLTISPTTGAVVASLALGHANTWTALQTFGNNISLGGAQLAVAGLATNDFLMYNGTNWINKPLGSINTNVELIATNSGGYVNSPTLSTQGWNFGAAEDWQQYVEVSASHTASRWHLQLNATDMLTIDPGPASNDMGTVTMGLSLSLMSLGIAHSSVTVADGSGYGLILQSAGSVTAQSLAAGGNGIVQLLVKPGASASITFADYNPGGNSVTLTTIADAATSTTTLVNSPTLTYNALYWNGTASTAYKATEQFIVSAVTPAGHLAWSIGGTTVATLDQAGNMTLSGSLTAGNITLAAGNNIVLSSAAATSVTTTQNSPYEDWLGAYWNGTASVQYGGRLYWVQDATTPTGHFSFNLNNAGTITEILQMNQAGNITFPGTAAKTITGPGTGGLTVTVASGPFTLSTTTSGTLAITSAGALNLTQGAASTWTVATSLGISGGILNFNVSSNFATNINTGTSTGAVNIGNSAAGVITIQGGTAGAASIYLMSGSTIVLNITTAADFNITPAASRNVNITLTGGGAFYASGGGIALNANSNFVTNINTGTSTGAVSIGNSAAGALTIASGAASTLTVTGANLTISTATSGILALTSAGALNLTGAAASTWDIGANTLSIQTTNHGGITLGGNLSFSATTYNIIMSAIGNLTSALVQNRVTVQQSLASSTVLTNVTNMVFTPGTSQDWAFEFLILWDSPNTENIQFAITAPTGATIYYETIDFNSSNAIAIFKANVSGDAFTLGGQGAGTIYPTVIKGIIRMSTTAGNCQLQFAQGTSGATNTNIDIGSHVIAMRLV